MEPLGIEGAWSTKGPIHRDERGSFREWFREDEFRATTGYRLPLAQANFSISRQHVVRGIHFADVPPGQAKYVTCAVGAILDVVVDVRVGSPTFGAVIEEMLSASANKALFLAEGLGHAWVPLTPSATMIYICSQPYTPASEHAVLPTDPALDIGWPTLVPVLSEKDATAPTLDQAQRQGILPDYDTCVKYAAQRLAQE